jgi:hypothetical protein
MEPQADFGWIMSTSVEMDSRIGPMMERGFDYRDPFAELLIDAREIFTHRGPDVVPNNHCAKMERRRRGFWMPGLGNQ